MKRRAAILKALEAGEASGTEVMERMEPHWRESVWRKAFQRPPYFELRQLVREGVVLERETPPTARRGWRPGYAYRLAARPNARLSEEGGGSDG